MSRAAIARVLLGRVAALHEKCVALDHLEHLSPAERRARETLLRAQASNLIWRCRELLTEIDPFYLRRGDPIFETRVVPVRARCILPADDESGMESYS